MDLADLPGDLDLEDELTDAEQAEVIARLKLWSLGDDLPEVHP